VADQMDAADGLPLAQDRLADGLFEQGVRYLQLDAIRLRASVAAALSLNTTAASTV